MSGPALQGRACLAARVYRGRRVLLLAEGFCHVPLGHVAAPDLPWWGCATWQSQTTPSGSAGARTRGSSGPLPGGRSRDLAGRSGPPRLEVRPAYVEVQDLLRWILVRSLTETRGVTGPPPGSRSGALGPLGGSPEFFPTETRGATGPFLYEGSGPGPSVC